MEASMSTATVTTLPLKADFKALVKKAKEPAKEPTAALRQK
jgi:hypothetical protein